MNKIWRSNDLEEEDARPSSHHETREGEHGPDEHTRLLPNRVESTQGVYLSPDDPAVSPYNLWSIRATRYLTIFFTLATFAWWVILLVSMFVTPPGFHTRGSGFFCFSYASLALANLLFSLMFFAVPSKAVRILSLIMSGFLLVNAVMVISVEKTRHEEGWVGMVSTLWALLMAIWTLVTDRLVAWGKSEEEQRLTGRAESRRSLGEWTAVLVSIICMVVFVAVVVLMTCTLILRALDAGLAPPGELYWVDGDKYKLHVYCHGNQTDVKGNKVPTVLIEGGEGPTEDGLWQFANDAISNGTISRYCFVDRPGVAWSDTAPSPLSAGMAVEVMSEALARAGEEGPWVLMSAGVGSLYSRIFSARHGKEIKGMLLIDPLHEDFMAATLGSAGRGFMLWVRGVLSPLGIDRVPGALFRGRTKEDRVWGRSSYQTGKSIFSKLQENLVAGTLSKRDVDTSRAIQLPRVPFSVVSSGVEVRKSSEWEEKQRDLTHITEKLQHWDIVNRAPHQVWDTLEGRQIIEKRLGSLVKG